MGIGVLAHLEAYTPMGSGVCTNANGQRVQYCQNDKMYNTECKAFCDNMPNCIGFNPDTHRGDRSRGKCFIFYSGSWSGTGFETEGCYQGGELGPIRGHDGREGGMCY